MEFALGEARSYIWIAAKQSVTAQEIPARGVIQTAAKKLHDAMERAFSVMMELILQGQAIGRLQPGDPERVGLVLFSTIQGIARTY